MVSQPLAVVSQPLAVVSQPLAVVSQPIANGSLSLAPFDSMEEPLVLLIQCSECLCECLLMLPLQQEAFFYNNNLKK